MVFQIDTSRRTQEQIWAEAGSAGSAPAYLIATEQLYGQQPSAPTVVISARTAKAVGKFVG
jgi:hypothetical protein